MRLWSAVDETRAKGEEAKEDAKTVQIRQLASENGRCCVLGQISGYTKAFSE